jgi:arylsulfatase
MMLAMVLQSDLSTAVLAAERPNIVIILADDMGFSDLGCYGSRIEIPNLDRFAAGGLRFTQFYNCARCCPSRASLLSGLYPHQRGAEHSLRSARWCVTMEGPAGIGLSANMRIS